MGMTIPEIRALLDHADEGELAALERSLAADTRKGVKAALGVARRRVEAEKAERARIESLYTFERGLLAEDQDIIVGLDEVGRGALAGPLAVGAVVLPVSSRIPGLNDSKQLTPAQRQVVAQAVKQEAIAWAVEYVPADEIDRLGMTESLKRAFSQAVSAIERAGVRPDVVLLDGNPLGFDKREVNVVKGDAKCASIAAASVVAKVSRDELMCQMAGEYPAYSFEENKGYGSPQHIEVIKVEGLSAVHRRSFCRSFMQESLF